MSIPWLMYCALVIGTLLNVLGDIHSTQWRNGVLFSLPGYQVSSLLPCVLCYAADLLCWLWALKLGATLGRTAIVWKSLGFVMLMIVGKYKFGEIISPISWCGICLCFLGMALAEVGSW